MDPKTLAAAVTTYLGAGLPYPTAVGTAVQRHRLTAVLGTAPTEQQLKSFGRALGWGYSAAWATEESAVRHALATAEGLGL